MKIIHRLTAVVILFACGCGAKLERISEHIYFVQGAGDAPNQLAVNTSHGPVVVDTRLNPLVSDDVLAEVRNLTGWEDASYLVNSSALPYRWLSNYTFKRAEIVASETTLHFMMQEAPVFMKALEERSPHPPWAGEIRPVFPTMTFTGKLVLRAADTRIHILEMPAGVVPGNSVVWLPDAGLLYTGDLVTRDIAPPLDYASPELWNEALEKISRLPVKIIIPGFGDRGDASLIEDQKRCVRALADAPANIPSVCLKHWSRDRELEEKIKRLGEKRRETVTPKQ